MCVGPLDYKQVWRSVPTPAPLTSGMSWAQAAWLWQDSFRALSWVLVPHKLSRKGIWLGIPRTRMIRQGEVEPGKEQAPSGLARVQPLGRADVSQVLVVGLNQEWNLGPIEPVMPLFQGQLYWFPFLSAGKSCCEKMHWQVQFLAIGSSLGQNSPRPNI